MKRCLELAARGGGLTAPNPMVGAVLVCGDRIIGEGFHEKYGSAHAEINCLDSVRPEDRHLIPESTMYVSLEPCAHHGKTPPCAVRLVDKKVKRVIVSNEDPFEKVGGRGMKILSEGGMDTGSGVLASEGRWLNRRFFCFHTRKRPYIILKWAQTEGGYFAPEDRTRFQISSKHSQQLVHRWRSREGAIMVGTETAISDDPGLTTRLWDGPNPLRIVLDRRLRLPQALKLFNREASTWIVNETRDDMDGNLRYLKLPFDEGLLPALMDNLHDAGILSLIVEGGATLLNSFISGQLWDEARIFRCGEALTEGVPAPQLEDCTPAIDLIIASDRLQLYVNKNSRYQYETGMEL